MKLIITIGLGSFIGGILRYLLSQIIHEKYVSSFPIGTLIVNIIGCLAIGMVYGLSDRGSLPQEFRLFLATGILGGFTTFSAFSNESFIMIQEGQYLYGFTYISLSIILGIFSTFIGYSLIKIL